jgi:O-antigen/teichoic acid export membrane protein
MLQAASQVSETAEAPSRPSLGRLLFSGSSALGIATIAERGLGFLANLAAARIGGTQVFGAYSVAMTTANNIASYAGAGIGNTANRFSGDFPYGHAGYRGLQKGLARVSLGSAALASAVLWFAAEPLARSLLRNPVLTPLLRLAAVSAGAIILLECLRGFLVGQRMFGALFALCILSGGGLVAVLPAASMRGPSPMVIGQAAVALGAVFLCVIFSRRLGYSPPRAGGKEDGPGPADLVRFSLVQLASMVGINAAGWWIASMVARADTSLVQMGLYSVASQLRNMSAMPSWLISQTAYAQLSETGGKHYGGPGRVTLLSTIAATAVSLMIAGPLAALMPWIVLHLYGQGFAGAELAGTLAVVTGLVHMSGAPAANRLTVVSLRLTGFINGAWAVLVIGFGTWLVPRGGAGEATASFLGAHLFSLVAVLVALLRLNAVPREMVTVSVPPFVAAMFMAVLGWMRSVSSHKAALSMGMLTGTVLLLWISLVVGRKSSGAAQAFTLARLIPGPLAWASRKKPD